MNRRRPRSQLAPKLAPNAPVRLSIGRHEVESYFAKLTRSRLKRGVFHSIVDLQAAINRFLAETNDEPKPFIWTAHPDKIIAAADRGRQALESIH